MNRFAHQGTAGWDSWRELKDVFGVSLGLPEQELEMVTEMESSLFEEPLFEEVEPPSSDDDLLSDPLFLLAMLDEEQG